MSRLLLTSDCLKTARSSPNSLMRPAAAPSCRLPRTRRAPRFANSRAVALPIPLDAPVMRTTWLMIFSLRRHPVEHTEQDSERAGPGLRELAMYGVSHSAPNEYREMVRTDGTRRDVVPGNSGLDARPTVGHVATDEPIAVA